MSVDIIDYNECPRAQCDALDKKNLTEGPQVVRHGNRNSTSESTAESGTTRIIRTFTEFLELSRAVSLVISCFRGDTANLERTMYTLFVGFSWVFRGSPCRGADGRCRSSYK